MKSADPAVLRVEGISKRFGSVQANLDVSLDVRAGEIHALLGENGAGKSTLMNLVYGLHVPDAGHIFIAGKRAEIRHPKDAIRLGIGMVHQDFMLVPSLSVAENVVLGLDGGRLRLRIGRIASRIRELSERYSLDVDPDQLVDDLSIGAQQRVEILKLLYRDATLLIFDEPTAVLTPHEADRLFEICIALKHAGAAIVMITHKFREVFAVADRVSVLRAGRMVGTFSSAEVDSRTLATLMVGEAFADGADESVPDGRPDGADADETIQIESLAVRDSIGVERLSEVSLTGKKGEILGIAGVDGNGQSELARALMGLCAIAGGRIFLSGVEITRLSATDRRRRGMAYVPSDRRGVGSVAELNIVDNVLLGYQRIAHTHRHLVLDYDGARLLAQGVVTGMGMRTNDFETTARQLSGGTLQKLILGRELAREPAVLIAEHPTRGLDIAATRDLREQLLGLRERGCTVVLVSSEIDEILELSDRIAVLCDGKVMGVAPRDRLSAEDIGEMMAGVPLR
jgi:simple sugar transport system ATP-binding protein